MNDPSTKPAMDIQGEGKSATELLPLETASANDIGERLRAVGIPLTLQRLAVARIMLPAPVHLTADQVMARVRAFMPEISRATVYNTLKLFCERNLVRELIVDPERIVFDSNTSRHYHLYNSITGEVTDIPAGEMRVVGSAALPPGIELEEVDVIIRVRNKPA